MKISKRERPDYDKDINHFNSTESLNNLFIIYRIKDPKHQFLMAELFCEICDIQIYGRGKKAHDDLGDTLEEFWNSRKVLGTSENKKVQKVESLINQIWEFSNTVKYRNALVSILRSPEYFYMTHKELSEIQNNPVKYLSQVSMLNNHKSIFKKPGKQLSLNEIMDLNKDEIVEQCDLFYENLGEEFERYLKLNLFKNKSVEKYMLAMRRNINEIKKKVENKEIILYSSKLSSSFYPKTKNIIEDNFWTYKSNFYSDEWILKYIGYPQLMLKDNYDYMRIGFGLGPNYKLRNIVLTNSDLQSLGGVIRYASKKTFKDFNNEGYLCPIKTDDQSTDFKGLIDSKSYAQFKICFDLSKYSDYLLSQITDSILDYLFRDDEDYAKVMKKIFNMPIKLKDGQYVDIVFGTGAGIKGNFDCITIANMLMVDFTAYKFNLEYKNIMVVGDDIYIDSNYEDFSRRLFEVYTHFNCKINKTKSRAIDTEGKVSFCNRHWWYDNIKDEMEPWNGLAPGLWMKQIYSLNRLNAIYSIMKGTNQEVNHEIMDKLFVANRRHIDREFVINKMDIDLDMTYQSMKEVPYQLNGLADGMEGYDGTLQDWVNIVYHQFDTYVFMMANNSKIREIFARYYELFPDHPILSELMVSNGGYLSVVEDINKAYQRVVEDPSYDNHIRFSKAVRSGTMKFAKMDTDSRRISTKDRTSDFFNEDKFYRPKSIGIQSINQQNFSNIEINVLSSVSDRVPVAEMWMKIKNNERGIIRNGQSHFWASENTIIMNNRGPSGAYVRLFTFDERRKNGNYENWDHSWENINFVFEELYPGNQGISLEEKRDYLNTLNNCIWRMKRSVNKTIIDLLDLL